MRVHLDTDVVVWLFGGELERIPEPTRRLMDACRPLVSPMIRLELALLYDLGRIDQPAPVVLEELRVHADLGGAESGFDRVAAIAATLGWTRDPFDRMIAAHALADDLPLVTRDRTLRAHCAVATWGGTTDGR